MNDDPRLERLKCQSLGRQAQQAAWLLGALLRRIEREAPEAQWRLREAVETLQLLSRQCAWQEASEPAPADGPRQGELF